MIPDFFLSPEQFNHVSIWKTIIGILIVLFGSFIGVEIRLGNKDEDL